MNQFGLSFHHLGLAVRKPESAMLFLNTLGYTCGAPVFDKKQNVNLMMCCHTTDPDVEIISPGKGPGPIDRLVERNANGIIYHTCYVTSDLERTLSALEAVGLRHLRVVEPTPAVLLDGLLVSFYQIIGIGLVEFIERPISLGGEDRWGKT